jgi:hypothetical protein
MLNVLLLFQLPVFLFNTRIYDVHFRITVRMTVDQSIYHPRFYHILWLLNQILKTKI